MKMRSWSCKPGSMLVPSTFTGSYRKMMKKNEMAMEMMRSRTHVLSPRARHTDCFAACFCGSGCDGGAICCGDSMLLLKIIDAENGLRFHFERRYRVPCLDRITTV